MSDLIDGGLERIELNQEHLKELIENRLGYLEKKVEDHETRLRAATEGVTQFKGWFGLSLAGLSLLSIFRPPGTTFP